MCIPGGMQDFNYVYGSCWEVTFELSCCKYPVADTLTLEWRNNKEALLSFMEQVHMGAKGKYLCVFFYHFIDILATGKL